MGTPSRREASLQKTRFAVSSVSQIDVGRLRASVLAELGVPLGAGPGWFLLLFGLVGRLWAPRMVFWVLQIDFVLST